MKGSEPRVFKTAERIVRWVVTPRRPPGQATAQGACILSIVAEKSGLDALFFARDDAGGGQSQAIGGPLSGKTVATAPADGDGFRGSRKD